VISFIPSTTVHQALKHLADLNAISRMVAALSQVVREEMKWSPQLEQEISVRLFSALRATFVILDSRLSPELITPSDLDPLLERVISQTWMETILFLSESDLSLTGMLDLVNAIRGVIIQELTNVRLLELNTFHILGLLFDWINGQLVTQWEEQRKPHDRVLSFGAVEINRLRPIVESVRSPVDLHPVFQLIVERVRTSGIWPMCAIGIIDPDFKEIIVPAQAGFAETYPRDITFPATGSATLETILRNQPIAISDVAENTEFPVLQEAARTAGYRSILLVPLVIEEIRAVVTFGSSEPHEFTQDEILLANAIAQQVMIAIENARHYEREKQRVEELESLNKLIGEQNLLLQRVAETHKALTRLVLDEAGFEGILEAVRSLLGNPVAIEDENFQLLGFTQDWEHFDSHRLASIQAGGTVKELFSNPEIAVILSELRKNRRPTLIPTLPSTGIEKRRIVAPIIVGKETLGYVWVMESLRRFDEQDLITAEQAALVLALEMVKQRAAYETELRLKADFMDDLLSMRPIRESELRKRASRLGYGFNRPTSLLLVECVGTRWGLKDETGRDDLVNDVADQRDRHLLKRIQDIVNRHSRENIVSLQGGRTLVIVPVSKQPDAVSTQIVQLADAIRRDLKRIDPEMKVLIGTGDVYEGLAGFRKTYDQARRSIEIARNLGRVDETFHLKDFGIYGILYHEGEQGELMQFARDTLRPLIDYDANHRTELLRTMSLLLNNQGRLSETARRLYIHVNTLRQRIERIEELLGTKIDDPWMRLNLHLALQIYLVSDSNNPPE
jgi:GAF domain-containing protein